MKIFSFDRDAFNDSFSVNSWAVMPPLYIAGSSSHRNGQNRDGQESALSGYSLFKRCCKVDRVTGKISDPRKRQGRRPKTRQMGRNYHKDQPGWAEYA
jgi:hypothetical protein